MVNVREKVLGSFALAILFLWAGASQAASSPTTASTPGAAHSMTQQSNRASTEPLLSPGAAKRFTVVAIDGALMSRHGTVVLKRGIDFAVKKRSSLVVIYLDTPGGRSDIMLGMRDAIVDSPLPTVAFVRQAYSAGALLALSCDRIYMHPIAHIGDAIPLMLAAGQPTELQGDLKEKILRPMIKEFTTTARVKGHPEKLAEAMVDLDADLPEWGAPKGKILVLDAEQAVKAGLAVKVVDRVEDAVADAGLPGAERIDYKITVADRLASFLSTSIANVILIAIMIGGIVIEVKTPGFGVGGIIAIAAVFLFFWANWYANLAHWLEILLFLAGVGLVVIEISIPGFGIFGISGILCIVASIFLAMFRLPPQGFEFDYSRVAGAVRNLAWAMVIGAVGMVLIAKTIHRSRLWQRISLGEEMESKKGFTSFDDLSGVVGREGIALTDLRPVGTVRVVNRRFDAMTEGDFLTKGTTVKVLRVEGAQLVVEKQPGDSEAPPSTFI